MISCYKIAASLLINAAAFNFCSKSAAGQNSFLPIEVERVVPDVRAGRRAVASISSLMPASASSSAFHSFLSQEQHVQVAETVAEIARASGCEVHLLNVVPMPHIHPLPTEVAREYRELLKCYPERAQFLEHWSQELRSLGVENPGMKLRDGFPEEEILKEAAEGDFGLIAIGPHGWHSVSDLLLGSLFFVVAKHAKIGVLVVKPRK